MGAIAGQPCGELIGRVEQPSIAGFGREQNKLTAELRKRH
jgi:hypothetical protein